MPKTSAIGGVASLVLNISAIGYLRNLLTGLKKMEQVDRQSPLQ